ncbi:Lycopene beta cyclase [Morus notabilis]|uniref:lycopene beta-cyclase n=1 Tax=Morus notabilis TaxID=981085 RepID=W9SCX0_9ROSA|nr:lycopene beta cyclase, chloroplastic/chromoplastic [Morus notabilis]XP_024026532.1 lycopene beta cyclase, chloroplastic/chromoplastic [Morus notabilis]XP_024026533.1 lycopene beta cyclase, chloroplastic/chromoplastic [Morus notabilis]XP_024026534.1 lycopene beta cyclase, chloroplastic/chromoplastic [Morus notabilis]EXC00005.1 Lycopene beta cyclase [Morus notabilis]
MDTLLKTHNKLEFLHPLRGFSEKVGNSNPSRLQELRFGLKKPNPKWGRTACVKVSSSALLELVPETKKENLDFELPLYDPSKGLVVDLAVVGGGPAGLAVAQQVSDAGLSVCLIDPSPKVIWPNNYGVWVDEFEAMDLLDCLDTTWSGAVVFIDEKSKKDLGRPYGRVNRKQLKSKVMQKCISNGVKFHQAKVIKVIHEEAKSLLICNDGVTIQATVVLDATGFSRCHVQYDEPYNPGYQVAYGILAEVDEHPFDVDKMVFMDWRDSHLNNNKEIKERNSRIPTFLYAMPFSSNRIFLEETSLVARPGLAMKDIQERMVARLRHLGINVKSIEEDEHCVIPMGGPLPVLPQRVVGIGGTAGMVHPSTGYMVARTLAAAPIVANSIVQYLGSNGSLSGHELSAEVWKDLWPIQRRRQREFFCFGMDILLKLDLQGTRRFFDAFFDLEPHYWHGFLSSRLFLPELILFGLSLFSHASNTCRVEIMAKGTLPLAKMINNLIQDRD